MKTVLRNGSNGEITHIHYHANQYLTKEDYRIVEETEITPAMIEKTFGNLSFVLSEVANGSSDPKIIKLQILRTNNIVGHNGLFV